MDRLTATDDQAVQVEKQRAFPQERDDLIKAVDELKKASAVLGSKLEPYVMPSPVSVDPPKTTEQLPTAIQAIRESRERVNEVTDWLLRMSRDLEL